MQEKVSPDDDYSIMIVFLDLEVSDKRKQGRLKNTWKREVKDETEKIGLKTGDALNGAVW